MIHSTECYIWGRRCGYSWCELGESDCYQRNTSLLLVSISWTENGNSLNLWKLSWREMTLLHGNKFLALTILKNITSFKKK